MFIKKVLLIIFKNNNCYVNKNLSPKHKNERLLMFIKLNQLINIKNTVWEKDNL